MDHSDFFEAPFGHQARGAQRTGMRDPRQDHHAKVLIDLEGACQGARRPILSSSTDLRVPAHR
jgi:curved DNA-binding protein